MVQRFSRIYSILIVGAAASALSSPVHAQAPVTPAPAAPAPATPAAPGTPAPATPPGPCGPGVSNKNVAPDSRCFELRTYTVRPDGPGTIDLLHARFRQHSLGFFKRHNMEVVGFWQQADKPNALTYLLAYKDRAARDAAWKAFQSDPEWMKVRKEMQVGIQVDSIFLNATDYGTLK